MVTLLKHAEVAGRIGVSKSRLHKLIADGDFPRPIKLGTRSTRFADSEVETWIADRLAKRP